MFGQNRVLLSKLVSTSVLYLAPIVVPFYGNSILNRSLQRERIDKSLLILMTTGIEMGSVWMVKVFTAFLISCLINLLCIILDIIMIIMYFKIPFEFSIYNIVGGLILSPLFALSLFLILAFFFWYLRNTLVVTTFFTVGVTTGIWGLSMNKPITEFNQYILLAVALFLPVLLTIVFSTIISRQEKYKIGAI